MLDLAIIGGGPAGLSAGLYATRGGLANVELYECAMLGGQITGSSEIENYPGASKVVSGMELMSNWQEQCTRFGLKIKQQKVKQITKIDDGFNISFEGNSEDTQAKSIILCTGSIPRRAGIKGEDEFFGKGVSTCATCDGFFYKGKEVAVIGGGDSAIEEAIYLAKTCSKVYLVHRRDKFRAAPNTVEHLHNTKNIELVLNANCDEVVGDNMGVIGLRVSDKKTNKERLLEVPGVFVFVGRDVINELIKQDDGSYLCDINEQGEVLTNLKMTTSTKGVFVAGDMREQASKQVICAAGDGATAALSAIDYVDSLGKKG